MWYTAEIVNLFRDLHVLEHLHNSTLSIFHGVPQAWRVGPGGVSVNNAPTKFGCSVSASVGISHPRGRASLSIQCPVHMVAADMPDVVRMHIGGGAVVDRAVVEAATPGLVVESTGEDAGDVLVFHRAALHSADAWNSVLINVTF